MSGRDGGPAYPVATACNEAGGYGHQSGRQEWQYGGLTVRQAYKIAALERLHIQIMRESWEGQNMYLKNCANTCAMLADAMLAEDAEFAKETPDA